MAGQRWEHSFQPGDSFKKRQRAHGGAHSDFREAVATARPLPPPTTPAPPTARRDPAPAPTPPDEDRCSRGEWCSGRVITIDNGTRTVTPATTPRAYCDGCQDFIGTCLDEFPALYLRLHAELGEHRAEGVQVHVPFGPQVPLNTAIDAQMRAMTETLYSWEERIRDVARLSGLGLHEHEPQDDLMDLERSVAIIYPDRVSMLLSLGPQEMVRFVPAWAITEEDGDAPLLDDNGGILKVMVMLDGRRAGQEVMHLHYMARRLLLETNPPMPLLPDFRCRVCERKLLRKAPPPWHEDGEWFWSKCDGCGDEMSREDYDTNARRWIAYEKAHLETAMLAG